MRFRKIVKRVSQEVSRITCDFCKKDIDRKGACNGDDVTIEATTGEVYPECDCRTVQRVDCCASCWDDKVRPALEALGATFFEGPTDDETEGLPLDPVAKHDATDRA